MRRALLADCWPSIASFEALCIAWQAARRHKRYARSAAEFSWNAEAELLRLRDELQAENYAPGPYRLFSIRQPKARIIAASPFRDRIVHHALVAAIEPIYERCFIHDSYATRVGKGTHAALLRFHHFFRQHRYVLKCDVAKFFPSIDHEILKAVLRKKISCGRTLALADIIIDHSPESVDRYLASYPGDDPSASQPRRAGIPIGNLTSQFFANVYLDQLDHFLKERLRMGAYLRYMDDFCLFSDNKDQLFSSLHAIEDFLSGLRLSLRYPKTRLYSTGEGVEFLGYRVFTNHRRIATGTARRMERRLAEKHALLTARWVPPEFFRQSLASCLGHLRWANTKGLVTRIGERGGWLA
jgi:retron-type reverse transcriptase